MKPLRNPDLRACRAKSREVAAALKSLSSVKSQVAFTSFCHAQIAESVEVARLTHGGGKYARLAERIQSRVEALPALLTPAHIARDAQAAAVFACEDDDATECQAWADAAVAQLNNILEILEKK